MRFSPTTFLQVMNRNKGALATNTSELMIEIRDFPLNIASFAICIETNHLTEALDLLKKCLSMKYANINITHFCQLHQACKQYGRKDVIK